MKACCVNHHVKVPNLHAITGNAESQFLQFRGARMPSYERSAASKRMDTADLDVNQVRSVSEELRDGVSRNLDLRGQE